MKIIQNSIIKQIIPLFLLISILFNSCGIYKRADVKDFPIKDSEKRKKNIDEGRGVTFGTVLGGKKSGKFDFASSNEMWRATIAVLDFAPLINADYGGGIVITDWYSNDGNEDQSIKISVQFLSNEIRADGLDVKVYKKNCNNNQNCKISKIESSINQEIKLAILKKASLIKKNINKKRVEETGGYKIPKKQQ